MVFQCLAHTVEWENHRWRRLDNLHRLRNRFDPYLTKELAQELGVTVAAIVRVAQSCNMKGDSKYHQEVRTSKSGCVHRYSEAAKSRFRQGLGLANGA